MQNQITPETEAKLKFATEGTLNDYYPYLSVINNNINQITSAVDFINLQFESESESESISDECVKLLNLKRVNEYFLLITILHLDLSVIVSLFMNGKSEYEKLFALKQGIVIINEGYKKIFSFVKPNKDGSINYTERNKSFWYRDIRNITEKYPTLNSQFDLITEQLDDYYATSFDTIYEFRNLTVHYDEEPVKFYKMLNSLETEEIFKKLTGFVRIIDKMYQFVTSLISVIENDNKNASIESKKHIDSQIAKLEDISKSKIGENDLFKLTINESINTLKKLREL